MDQDDTWYWGMPRLRPHCVIWGPNSSFPKGHSRPISGPCLLWPNGWEVQPFGHNWHGPWFMRTQASVNSKLGGCCAPFRGESWYRGRGLSPYQVASWSVQPFDQYTNVTETNRQDRTTVRWQGQGDRFINGRPKMALVGSLVTTLTGNWIILRPLFLQTYLKCLHEHLRRLHAQVELAQ